VADRKKKAVPIKKGETSPIPSKDLGRVGKYSDPPWEKKGKKGKRKGVGHSIQWGLWCG